jgi:Ca-activated chloride channel homolog
MIEREESNASGVAVTFKWPWALWALLVIPGLLALYGVLQWRRRRAARRFASPALYPAIAPHRPGWRRHVPVALYVVALSSLLLALGRPQAAATVPRERATVMLVLDTSNSMRFGDVSPSRLEAAVTAAKRFLTELPDRYPAGAVAFNNQATVLNRPTTDRAALSTAFVGLRTRAETAIGDGLFRGLQLVAHPSAGRAAPAVLLLISDGRNTIGVDPLAVAARARSLGVTVYAIGVGDPTGGAHPADWANLRAIAQTAGGRFFAAPDAASLRAVYSDLGSRVSQVTEQREVTASFVAAGIAVLVVGGIASAMWFGRFP